MFYSKNYAKRLSYKKMPLNAKTPYRLTKVSHLEINFS